MQHARPWRFLLAAVWTAWCAGGTQASQPDDPPPVPGERLVEHARQSMQALRMEDSMRLRALTQAIAIAAMSDGKMPADLGSVVMTMPGVRDDGHGGAMTIEKGALALSPVDDANVKVPAGADAAWVNQHSSYVYLAGAREGKGVLLDDVPEWGSIAIAHLKLEAGLPAEKTDHNPEARLFTVAFVDGHVEVLTRAEAEGIIRDSQAVFEALRTGGPMPGRWQTLAELRVIADGLKAYVHKNDGRLPPDLGSVLEYLPRDHKLAFTPKQRASLFLSPRVRASTFIPDDPTADWVNQHATYVYLVEGVTPWERVEDRDRTILLHAKPDDAVAVPRPGGAVAMVGVITASFGAALEPVEYLQRILPESEQVLAAARTGTGLPDYQHAQRDVRVIAVAVSAYAAAHEGKLPGNVSEVLDYLPIVELLVGDEAEQARVFLSPAAERKTRLPEKVDAEWIRRNASYEYLGRAGEKLADMAQRDAQVLVHSRLDEPFSLIAPGGMTLPVVVVADASGFRRFAVIGTGNPNQSIEREIEESKKRP